MLPSGLAEIVDNDEDLTRFLTSSSLFNAAGVKPAAFMPNPQNRETSVFRYGSEPRERLWRIGSEHLTAGRTLHAAAIFKARHVRSSQLDVVPQEPPPCHANIVGWPWPQTDPELSKSQQKELASLIAQQAEVFRR